MFVRISNEDISILIKIFEKACGAVSEYRVEYFRFCLKLIKDNTDYVVEFYIWCYWYNRKIADYISYIYSYTEYKNLFIDYLRKTN